MVAVERHLLVVMVLLPSWAISKPDFAEIEGG